MGRCDGCIHQALSSTQHPSGRTGVVFKFTTNISHLTNRAPCVPRRSSSMRVGEVVDKSFANSKENFCEVEGDDILGVAPQATNLLRPAGSPFAVPLHQRPRTWRGTLGIKLASTCHIMWQSKTWAQAPSRAHSTIIGQYRHVTRTQAN